MSDPMKILKAVNFADDRDLLDAEQALGLTGGHTAGMIRRKKLIRTVLLAAVLSALFVGTAFASGLFGLMDRLSPGRNPVEILHSTPELQTGEIPSPRPTGGYLSLYGLNKSPEALANAEYMAYHWEYISRKGNACTEQGLGYWDWLPEDESWLEEDETLKQLHDIYLFDNREMADKLLAVAEKYALKLYTVAAYPRTLEEFYALAGTEPFFLPEEDAGSLTCKYVFEDGAFSCEGLLSVGGENLLYTLTRGTPGYLDPYTRYVEEPEAYEEWPYVTARGAGVTISWRADAPIPGLNGEDSGDTLDQLFIFYEENQRRITLGCTAYDGMSAQRAQAIADCFDFSAACQGTPHVLPTMEAGPGGDFPIEQLAQSSEYRAWGEFTDWFELQTGKSEYGGAFPYGQQSIDEVAQRVAGIYSLTLPHSLTVLEEGEGTREARLALMGFDPFCSDVEPGALRAYDNGCFQLSFRTDGLALELNYIQKGSYYPLFHRLIWLDLPYLNYDAACGATVRIFSDAGDEQARDYILHQTQEGYVVLWSSGGSNSPAALEAAAACIDFTAFK